MLTNVFYELAKHPDVTSMMRSDLHALIDSGKGISNQTIQSLDILNGVINETLRLYLPVLALQRKTPPEGLMIDGTYIPGDMTVSCPQYVIGRSKSSVSMLWHPYLLKLIACPDR